MLIDQIKYLTSCTSHFCIKNFEIWISPISFPFELTSDVFCVILPQLHMNKDEKGFSCTQCCNVPCSVEALRSMCRGLFKIKTINFEVEKQAKFQTKSTICHQANRDDPKVRQMQAWQSGLTWLRPYATGDPDQMFWKHVFIVLKQEMSKWVRNIVTGRGGVLFGRRVHLSCGGSEGYYPCWLGRVVLICAGGKAYYPLSVLL